MRVAITGHRPDVFLQSHYTDGQVKLIAEGIVATFQRQYQKEEESLIFNLGGAIGTDQWVGNACIELGVPYNLYTPMSIETQGKYWTKEQQEELAKQYQKAQGVTIIDPSGNYNVSNYFARNHRMVDDSDIVVAFWLGKRRGGTFEAIKYALSKSKFVFNAMDGLRPIFNSNIEKGWTPPSLRGE